MYVFVFMCVQEDVFALVNVYVHVEVRNNTRCFSSSAVHYFSLIGLVLAKKAILACHDTSGMGVFPSTGIANTHSDVWPLIIWILKTELRSLCFLFLYITYIFIDSLGISSCIPILLTFQSPHISSHPCSVSHKKKPEK